MKTRNLDLRWKRVMCRVCGDRWLCTPWKDYYGNPTTRSNGVCFTCYHAEDDPPPSVTRIGEHTGHYVYRNGEVRIGPWPPPAPPHWQGGGEPS